jgi:hypothetical protein
MLIQEVADAPEHVDSVRFETETFWPSGDRRIPHSAGIRPKLEATELRSVSALVSGDADSIEIKQPRKASSKIRQGGGAFFAPRGPAESTPINFVEDRTVCTRRVYSASQPPCDADSETRVPRI